MHSVLLLIVSVLLPSLHASVPACKPYLDTFEELTASQLPQFTNVETYHGIEYKAFTVATRSPITGTVGGLQPASGNKTAGFTMLTDLLQVGSLTLRPFGYLSASDQIKSFDLSSFYFGCTINTRTPAVSTNQACSVYIIGYDENSSQGPTTRADFFPSNPLDSDMQLVKLPAGFQKLSKVVLSVADAALDVSQTVLFVDNVNHCNRS